MLVCINHQGFVNIIKAQYLVFKKLHLMGVGYRPISNSDFDEENEIIAIKNVKMTYYNCLREGSDV